MITNPILYSIQIPGQDICKQIEDMPAGIEAKLNNAQIWNIVIRQIMTYTSDYAAELPPAGADCAFNRGRRAFTIILMFARKSASYCTHKAATAASLATALGG